MQTLIKYFLFFYYMAFLVFAMILPSYRVWKSTGINPYKLGNSDSAHDYIGRLFRLTLVACALVVVAFSFLPFIYEKFILIPYFSRPVFVWMGMALLLFSLLWVLQAQSNMRASWRIGIDEHVKTELVHRGLFHTSRNPIFLGMRMMLVGLFLLLPNAVMLAIWIAGELLIQIQVRLEEEFLVRTHGERYLAYQKQVRRWL